MRAFFFRLILLCLPASVAAQDISVLQEPGTVLLMRHALAPGTGDPGHFALDDCGTQRVLDDAGRAQAARIGDALRAAGIAPDQVLTSQWCRCRDTASLLGLGPVRDLPSLNSHFAGRGDEASQTAETLRFISALPTGVRVIMVTHQVNITALTGLFPRSGEIIAVRPGADGLEVTGRFLIAP